MKTIETEVLIIGGGVTGAGVMRDLALRGVECLLVDRKDLDAGASGGNHGLLHSGGRYVFADAETAAECRAEGEILKRLAPQCVDDCGGLFIAVEGDDPDYAAAFPRRCAEAGVPCEEITPGRAREMEPELAGDVFAAYRTPDAAIDPFRLTLENVAHARALNGSRFLPHMEVVAFERAAGRVTAAICRDLAGGEELRVAARQFVNAGGAWAMRIARLAGCEDVRLLYSKGSLIISSTRLARAALNRLRPPGDGDILMPGGTVSILGTTSVTVEDPDAIHPTAAEVNRLLEEGARMVPALAEARFIRAYSGVRPLLRTAGASGEDGRKAGRGFALFDHAGQGVRNFCTIAGGKLTTFRLMAEKTGDLVAARLGLKAPCRTRETPLPSARAVRLTEPGYSARAWARRENCADLILCECEMTPQSDVEAILRAAPGAERRMTLAAIARRSRIGKGACQGAFCAMRLTSFLHERGVHEGREGMDDMRDFLAERFKGVRPVCWGAQAAQAELAEIMHRAIMGLDIAPAEWPEAEDEG